MKKCLNCKKESEYGFCSINCMEKWVIDFKKKTKRGKKMKKYTIPCLIYYCKKCDTDIGWPNTPSHVRRYGHSVTVKLFT